MEWRKKKGKKGFLGYKDIVEISFLLCWSWFCRFLVCLSFWWCLWVFVVLVVVFDWKVFIWGLRKFLILFLIVGKNFKLFGFFICFVCFGWCNWWEFRFKDNVIDVLIVLFLVIWYCVMFEFVFCNECDVGVCNFVIWYFFLDWWELGMFGNFIDIFLFVWGEDLDNVMIGFVFVIFFIGEVEM